MKKTQKSHNSTVRMSLSLEELSAYIEDRLSPEERASVDEFLTDNPLYQETLSILRENYLEDPAFLDAVAAAETRFDKALEKEVSQISLQPAQTPDPISSKDTIPQRSTWTATSSQPAASPSALTPWYARSWVKVAASLFLVLGIAAIWLGVSLFPSSAVRFASGAMVHYEPNAEMSSNADEALGLYRTKKYQEAIPVLELALSEEGSPRMQEKLQMFIGVSHAKVGELEASIPFFQEVITTKQGSLKLDAQWYLSLVYIQLGNVEEATSLLQTIGTHTPQSRREEDLVGQSKELLKLIS